MRKWTVILIGSMLLLQGCNSNNSDELTQPEKEREVMHEGLDEQLIEAVEREDTDVVSNLIKEGVDINAQDSKQRTATMIATYNNDVSTAKVLIEAGADVNIQDDMLNNPFLYAGAEGYLEILKLIIQAGADPTITNRYGGTALIPASEHGYIDVVNELLTNTDIDVNHINDLGWTALLEAIILGNGSNKQQQTIQLLIEHGADVSIPDSNKVSPLTHAQERGFKEIEETLLSAGAK
ncbi:ankyrin repeat domain-containing protein [Bacillus sp. FSL K6-3431]|uniref:ankyrin repeat domain-containing protein n=1 Tax=Bacillus sp. FSL K6-3431 TaxID=2921500 RepID=UPI0030F7276D